MKTKISILIFALLALSGCTTTTTTDDAFDWDHGTWKSE